MPTDAEVGWFESLLGKAWARMIFNRFVLFPLQLYPFVGLALSAWMRAYGTSRYLHSKYFKAKKMTPAQISVYMEERKWDYRRKNSLLHYILSEACSSWPFLLPYSLRFHFCVGRVNANHRDLLQRLQSNWSSNVGSW
jgi:hypothetical protein